MTLSLATVTTSGIVLTADSRQTYKNRAGMVRIGSDSAMKLFALSDRVGVVIAGRAFLVDTSGVAKNTGWFIEEFKKSKLQLDWNTKEVAENLGDYLGSFFVKKEFEALSERIVKDISEKGGIDIVVKEPNGNLLPYTFKDAEGNTIEQAGYIDTINLIVAGIDDDGVGRSYFVNVPGGIQNEKDTNRGGALWIGQTDVLSRIVKGYASEIGNLGFVNKAAGENKKAVDDELNAMEYIINWGTMTIQDGIDFAVLVTRTTESIQRFSDGTHLSPGGITGVGGDIDIALITPEKGFVWLKKKQLQSEGCSVNLSDYPDVNLSKEENKTE